MPMQYGGSFAPPLDAAKLARYRAQALSAGPQVREVMLKLADMVELFQQTPESKLPSQRHPSGNGKIVHLEDAEVKRIWDSVPWLEECEYFEALFLTLDADAAQRNGAKLEAWRKAIRDALFATFFSLSGDDFFDMKNISLMYLKPASRDRAMRFMGKMGISVAELEAFQKAGRDWEAACNAAVQPGAVSPVPKPALEDTPLRNAAMHLLWFAVQLSQDREPLTNDKQRLHNQ